MRISSALFALASTLYKSKVSLEGGEINFVTPSKAQLLSSLMALGTCSPSVWMTKSSGPPEPLFTCICSVRRP